MSNSEDYERRKYLKSNPDAVRQAKECLKKHSKVRPNGGSKAAPPEPAPVAQIDAAAYTLADPPPSSAPFTKASDGEQPSRYNWAAPLAPEAYYGWRETVRLIEPHSEADPAAVSTGARTCPGGL